MTTQPTALELAEWLEKLTNYPGNGSAAAELRRQHEEIKKWMALYEGTASLCEKRGKRVEELEAQLAEWLKANGPGGWIHDMRLRLAEIEKQVGGTGSNIVIARWV